ncbi:uracil transporter, partial [Streptococcus sanguinis SK160]
IPSRGDWGFLPNFIFICIYIISLVSVPSRGEWRLLPAILKGIGAFILFPPPLEVNGRSY